MGKKSKRHRTSSNNSSAPKKPKAPVLREPTLVETKDNLRFEDPFVDEILQDNDDDDENFETQDVNDRMDHTNSSSSITTKVWNPLSSSCFGETTMDELEIHLEAYKMHHALSVEWPSLSFDFIKDTLGESRTRFPHSLWCVAGTQAPSPGQNYLSVMKLSDLDKVHVETEDDILGDEWDKPDNTNDDDDSDDESVDLDPCLEHFHIQHNDGGVNRVRTMPQDNSIVSTWSDSGKVHIYNISRHLNFMDRTNHLVGASSSKDHDYSIFTHVHGTEGFAMDWSTVQKGQLATGDCSGSIHLWTLANNEHGADFSVTPNCYDSEQSVEDLQWSPTEGTVLASAECGGSVKVYDIRAPHRAMLTQSEISSSDVNVLAWNRHVANLIATGDDDGALCVWDLRHFHNPLARFTCHSTPITSVEWHPTDESMLVASDDNGVYIYDLSVEEDDEEEEADSSSHPPTEEQLPAQLLFIHSGSRQYKEAHWHPQITSCCMTTALSGFSVFIPSNL